MNQLYPIAGTTTSPCASQDFDFLNYWVDQTVEKEILRGKKLQQLKQRPSVRKEKYDVINIENTNYYCERKQSNRRSKSPSMSRKKGRRNSPHRKNSPTRRKVSKKDLKSSCQRCPLRITELAVPTKRQCIDTWRSKHHVLPGIMIDRLRQNVLDLNPVVKITDAIECFKRHTYSKRKKSKSAKEKERKRKNNYENYCDDKIKKKPANTHESPYFCAMFGHKIAKELNKPLQITLNTELEMISKVVSVELEKLVNKGKKNNHRYVRNKRIYAEVAGKVSIWIANILEDTTFKILEDQLSDLEEEVGPVLDLIENLVDNVVDVCEPELDIIEVSSSSDTYNVETPTEYKYEEDISQLDESTKKEENKVDEPYTANDNISVEAEFPADAEPFEGSLDDFIKNELDNIIDCFDGDIPTEFEGIVFADIEDQTEQNKIPETEDGTDKEPNEFQDAHDFNFPINEPEINADDTVEGNSEAKESTPIIDSEQYVDKNTDPENDEVNQTLSEEDSIKKVKFSDINMVKNDDITEKQQAVLEKTSTFINRNQVFSAPNDQLLSNADESWPVEMTLPFLRPSESVSKSITSLGNIMESEEINSVDDDAKVEVIVNDAITDAKQLNETNEIITDSNDVTKLIGENTGTSGGAANEGTSNIKEQYEENELETVRNIDKKEQDIEKIRTEDTDENINKDALKIRRGLNIYAIDEGSYRSSTESVFDHHVPTETSKPEEINSVIIDDDAKVKAIVNDTITDAKQLNETNDIITDSNDVIKHAGENTGTSGRAANEGTGNIKEQYEEKKLENVKNIDKKEQDIEKIRTEDTDENINKDALKIRKGLNIYAIDEGSYRSSTESVFDHHVPTETVTYVHKLDKILEEQANQVATKVHEIFEKGESQVAKDDKILEDEPTEVAPKATEAPKAGIQTVDKEINTTFSLVQREDKSTSIVSQSLGDITKRFQTIKADEMFSSLRIKPKVDYKVHKNSAPSWVTRNNGEPSDSFYKSQETQKKEGNDKNIRLWCKDLENGFDNLELWNDWIVNTLENVKILERKKGRICLDKAREEFVKDWWHLKKNLDADVLTWIKRSKSTQDKMKSFRKIYQNFDMSL